MLKRTIAVLLVGGVVLGAAGPVQSKKTSDASYRPERVAKEPQWGGTDSPLRPGASLGGYCTFNFVYFEPGTKTKAPRAYIGTAAHCTDKLGEVVENPGLGPVGKVVYDSDLVKSTVDFSLIELDPAIVSQTNPQVLGWEGPVGVVDIETIAMGDQLDIYGYGLLVGETEPTRPRYGYLFSWSQDEYQADMPAVNGDSGAPLIHHATGTAFGIISRYGLAVPPSTDMGPMMPWILQELRKAGFEKIQLAVVK